MFILFLEKIRQLKYKANYYNEEKMKELDLIKKRPQSYN